MYPGRIQDARPLVSSQVHFTRQALENRAAIHRWDYPWLFLPEAVGPDVPTTGLEPEILAKMNSPRRLPQPYEWGEGLPPQAAKPVNLDFER